MSHWPIGPKEKKKSTIKNRTCSPNSVVFSAKKVAAKMWPPHLHHARNLRAETQWLQHVGVLRGEPEKPPLASGPKGRSGGCSKCHMTTIWV